MIQKTDLAGSFTLPGTSMTLNRMGYGAMQLAGPEVFGPPRDVDAAIAVLREGPEAQPRELWPKLLHHRYSGRLGPALSATADREPRWLRGLQPVRCLRVRIPPCCRLLYWLYFQMQ